MKTTFTLMAALAALTLTPITSQASDKEVNKPHYAHACVCPQHRQVALFVSGRGVGNGQPSSPTQTVSQAQTGQGGSITFFTGQR